MTKAADNNHYDIIIIGTGAGGGTLAHRLAPTGKRILILERGGFLPREKENWDAREVYQKERYHTQEQWYDSKGKPFRAQMSYWVGGNTKVYGAALLRLRERDFEAVEHKDGISPAWPLKYEDFEPYYSQAEQLYDVHGQAGEDPTEPARSDDFPYPAVSHEPRMEEIANGLTQWGLKPFHLPLGLKLNEVDKTLGACIRCSTCDGFPCLVQAKADADVNMIQPIRHEHNITLMTEAKVTRLLTNDSGEQVTAVEVMVDGEHHTVSSEIVVVACGAINSAALLLQSANDAHPTGLANSSNLVGRNLMKHITTAMVALNTTPNPSVYQKTIAVTDFYWGEEDFPYPMGLVQNTGTVTGDMMPAEAPELLAPLAKKVPSAGLQKIADYATGWWLQTEDLPDPDNRVRVEQEQIHLDYTPNNVEAAKRLTDRWVKILKEIEKCEHVIPFGIYPRFMTPREVVGHQCGTCVFGEDPEKSVLDLNCKTHDVDNLYVVDGAFFPSSSAVNPTLTIVANALRVGDHIAKQLG
ncbi:MAG: GMC family oxidoreductase [Phormidesmis sp.]